MAKSDVKTKQKKRHGNRLEFDWHTFDTLMQFKVTKEFVADYLGVCQKTIDRHLKEDKGMTYLEYNALKLQRTGLKLQQKAIEMALRGDRTMLIFCLKNISKWQDKVDAPEELEEYEVEFINV